MYISENKALPPTSPFFIKSSKCYAFLAILSKLILNLQIVNL